MKLDEVKDDCHTVGTMSERVKNMSAKVVDITMKKEDKLKALEAAIGQIEKSFR